MSKLDLFDIVDYIVSEGKIITEEYCGVKNAQIDYVHIFAKDEDEKEKLLKSIEKIGVVLEKPKTGITYQLFTPFETKSGKLHLVNIRFPDPKRNQRGAPDFRIPDYSSFKENMLGKENVNLIKRATFEMIEIWDNSKDVLVYFPSEPLTVALGIIN